jgi:hypothetical protein
MKATHVPSFTINYNFKTRDERQLNSHVKAYDIEGRPRPTGGGVHTIMIDLQINVISAKIPSGRWHNRKPN